MYNGFLRLAGNEIINARRTYQYVNKNMPGFPLKDCDPCEGLAEAIGDQEYESPLVDDAPWMDELDPALQGFYGVYPLAFDGTMDDTSEANTIEGLLDGGYTGVARAASREMRVRAMLIANDGLSLNSGMAWLKAALHPPPCDEHGGSCAGAQACMYAACPQIGDCYSDIPISQPDVGFNTVTPTSPFRRTISHSGLTAAWMEIPVTGGFAFSWSAHNPNTGALIESRGPIVSRRRNFLWNPTFDSTVTLGWFYDDVPTGSVLSWRSDGGADGGPYADFFPVSPGNTGQFWSRDTQTMFGPIVASFGMRGQDGPATVVAEIIDSASGGVLAARTFDAPLDWERFSLTTPNGRDVRLRFTVTGHAQFDQMMIETGTTMWPYFDGTSDPFDPLGGSLADEYDIFWEDLPQQSASSQIWTRGLLTGTQTQILRLEEVCVPEWQIRLEAISGSLSSGILHTSTREALPADEQAVPYERYFHDVVTTSGPTVIQEYDFDVGTAVEVEWVMVAGTPFAFAATSDLMHRVNMGQMPYFDWVDYVCEMPEDSPLLDPDCPPLPAAPRPPAVPNECIEDITAWKRVSVVVPGERISGWNQMLPTILLTTKATAVRQVRVRFTPNPFNWPVTTTTSRVNYATNPKGSSPNSMLRKIGYAALGSGSTLHSGVSGTDPDGPPVMGGTVPPNPTLPPGVKTYLAAVQTTSLLAAGSFGIESFAGGYNLVTPGKYITVSQYVLQSNTSPGMKMQLQFVTSGGADVGAPINGPTVGSQGAATFVRFAVGGVLVPATANRVKVSIITTLQTTNNARVEVSALLIESFDTPIPVPGTYFDGDSVGEGVDYNWTGYQGNSTSTGFYSPIDPCSYCSEFILSYLPAKSELTVDVLTKSAFASVDGIVKGASHLLYGTGGTPMTWPSLSCGISYVMTVDIPAAEDVSNIDISLSLTKQE